MWEEANLECQAMDATLVQITSEEQLSYLQVKLASFGLLDEWFWTSGTDVGRNGVWRWASSYSLTSPTLPVEEFIWSPFLQELEEPLEFYHNCLALDPNHAYHGTMTECGCTARAICQMK